MTTVMQQRNTMDLILGLVLDETFTPAELIQWLVNSQQDSAIPELISQAPQRRAFIPFFINFLRDQCPALQQQSQQSTWQAKPQPKTAGNVKRAELQCALGSSTAVRSRNFEDVFCELPDNRDNVANFPRLGVTDPGFRKDAFRRDFSSAPKRSDSTQTFPGEKNGRQKNRRQVPAPVPDIQDDQNFPVVGAIAGKPKPIRRITPTPVKQHWRKLTVSDFLPPEVSRERASPIQDKARRGSRATVDEETGLPRKGWPNGLQRSPPPAAPVDDTPRQQGPDQVPTDEYAVPLCESVTDRRKLDLLVDIYSCLINMGLVGNLTIELFFLLQLLTLKVKKAVAPEEQQEGSPVLLGTVHNCTYLSVGVLKRILGWLRFLDKSTLRLLCSVQRLAAFSPQLQTDLASLADDAPPVSRPWSSVQGVAFEASTDNQRNFSCDHNFHLFRKQRDMFYGLLQDWQRHQFDSGKGFEAHFPRRVTEILDVCDDPCNYSHLARLVLTQLVTSCSGGAETDADVGGDKFLAELKSSLPGKFERLEERFVHPLKVGGPCPSPAFPGCQGFFHDFVKAATSASFHQHLKDRCVERIVESEKEDVFVDADMPPGEEERRLFFSLVHRLKLLGLFLGLVEFLPYHSANKFPAEQRDAQRSIRNLKPLPIDVAGFLRKSMCRKRKLVTTLAWTVHFVAMMDPVATTLDGYKRILEQLSAIYNSDVMRSVEPTSFFARVLLGWLFEVLNVQPALFVRAGDGVSVSLEATPESLVDQQIVYACCPYLGELRCLLAEHLAGNKSRYGGEVRKITPVSARDVGDEPACIAKRLDRQLEENFFHLHPQSVKKTVEFVAERVSSNVAKLIRRDISVTIKDVVADAPEIVVDALKETEKATDAADLVFFRLKERLERESVKSCREQVDGLIPLLLPQDMQEQVVKTCCQLSAKSAALKVQQWLTVNVTKSLVKDLAKSPLACVPATPVKRDTAAHYGASCAFDVLDDLKRALRRLCCNRERIPAEEAVSLLERCAHSLDSRLEWTPSSVRVTQQTSFDFVVCLAIFSPSSFTHSVFVAALPLWTDSSVVQSMCGNLLCARNFQFVRMSGNTSRSWLKLEELLGMLVSEGFVATEDLKEMLQAVGELGRGWCNDSVARAADILRGLIDSDTANGSH
ncbi:unnamed protein product [Ixodes hexagonus]